MRRLIKQGLRFVAYPVIRYFDPRFGGLHERMDRLDRYAADLHGMLTAMECRLAEFERNISTDIETTVEVLLTHQRSTALLQEQIADLKKLLKKPLDGGAPNGRVNGTVRDPAQLDPDNAGAPGEGIAAEH